MRWVGASFYFWTKEKEKVELILIGTSIYKIKKFQNVNVIVMFVEV